MATSVDLIDMRTLYKTRNKRLILKKLKIILKETTSPTTKHYPQKSIYV